LREALWEGVEEPIMSHERKMLRRKSTVTGEINMYRKIVFCAIAAALLLPLSLMAAGTVSLPRTGLVSCYDEWGDEVSCAGTGQDGAIRAGVAWPATRFTSQANCITDNLTGLTWIKAVPTDRKMWQDVYVFIAAMNSQQICGYTDWRLPNINELQSLNNAGTANIVPWLTDQGFTGVGHSFYWSSTTVTSMAADYYPYHAWIIDFSLDYPRVWPWTKSQTEFVWPVRGDTTASSVPAKLWKTGQTTSVITGDDGYLQKGVAWPTGRFTTGGDGDTMVTDNLTGLVWTKDALAPGPDACTTRGAAMSWQGALDYIKCLNANNYLSHSDWRLPNQEEFLSLIDRSRFNPALPVAHPFRNVISDGSFAYWTSTTRMGLKNYAFYADLWVGFTEVKDKRTTGTGTYHYYAWPVRGGTVNTATATLTVTIGGNKKGTVSAEGLTCKTGKTTCAGAYTVGNEVVITAVPSAGYAFNNWTGCDSASDTVCRVTIAAVNAVTASFDALPNPVVAPASLSFGNLKAGATSSKSVAVTNTGGAHLIISSIDIDGSAEFTATPTGCTDSIEKGEKNCAISVTLAPTTFPAKAGNLRIYSNVTKKSPLLVKLAANAVPPKISVSPSSLNFGAVKIGETSAAMKVTIKNTGISDLSFTSIGLAETGIFAISQDGCSSHTLAQNGLCAVSLTFTPSAVPQADTTLSIVSTDPDAKRAAMTVTLKGKGKTR
jgi:hypothetical protein